MAAKMLVNIGVVASINADVVESAVCNPTKKDHWFIKTPITPRKITASTSDLFSRLKCLLYKDNPIKNNTINKSLSIVNKAGGKILNQQLSKYKIASPHHYTKC